MDKENGGGAVSKAADGKKKIIFEFLRYVLVGGICFVVDTGVMTLVKEIFFRENCTGLQMAICVAVGFIAGIVCNYLLSNLIVFKSEEQKKQGRNFGACMIFFAVGLMGFGLTELGMWLGVKIVGADGLWYILVKCFVAGVVMIWNYLGRKIFVYRGK